MRFYAGAPLKTVEGYLTGTVCVAGYELRTFRDEDRNVLERMSKVVIEQLKLRLKALTELEGEKQLTEEKHEFISIASHELRTPVTSLTAALQLMQRASIDSPPHFTELLDQANRSLLKLNKLIADLLDVNRAEARKVELHKSLFTIAHLINYCCLHIRHGATHRIHLEGDQELEVFGDEQRGDQVIVNLANNAFKYVPQVPDIYIHVSREGQFARIMVRDEVRAFRRNSSSIYLNVITGLRGTGPPRSREQ